MPASKFVLEVELGNDAMKLPLHVSKMLEAVAKKVPHVAMMKGGTVKILDDNGNTIGTWSYK